MTSSDGTVCQQPINLTRGLPSPQQVMLAEPYLSQPCPSDFRSRDAQDWRNYGGLQGLYEFRALFGPLLLGLPAEQVAVGENSSLALMHEAFSHLFIHGAPGEQPWRHQSGLKIICPVPGYDRHFSICAYFGIQMIPVAMDEHGPDMTAVEALVRDDPTIKGMWCVPKYSNPSGCTYSAQVVQRLAAMPTAAADFRLFWDNAYAVHTLTADDVANQPILQLCAAAGHAERALLFASTSKMLVPGAGVALFGASAENVCWWLAKRQCKTIGPDKVNQVRHLGFFGSAAGVLAHMQRHRELLAGKFARVEQVFSERLSGFSGVRWSKPKGGYFVCLETPPGTAKQIVSLAAAAGVIMTPAGATHPYGLDPADATLRIAPTYVDEAKLAVALAVIAGAVEQACAMRRP